MKKVLLSLGAAVLLAGAANAQVSYGLKAGLNLPKITGDVESPKMSTNFYVTGYADIPAAASFSIQPGISLQGKGGKGEGEGAGTLNLMYLEVPVNAVYYIPAGTGNAFVGAGPYAAFGLSGKTKVDGKSSDKNLFDDGGFKRFDAGVNFLAGYKLANGFLINAGYGLGLMNMLDTDADVSSKNSVLSFGVGFQF